jgi:hypothetical protein
MYELKPASLYAGQIETNFKAKQYSKDAFFYNGYGFDYTIPELKKADHVKEYAVVDEEDNCLGYLSYRIDAETRSAYNFGLFSFDKGNIGVIKAVYNHIEQLISKCHRVEWRVVCGNPAEKGYDKLCEKYNGQKVIFHDVTIDDDFNIHDEAVYKIITDK